MSDTEEKRGMRWEEEEEEEEERERYTSLSLKTHCRNPVPSLRTMKKRDFDCCRRLWTQPLILTLWSL